MAKKAAGSAGTKNLDTLKKKLARKPTLAWDMLSDAQRKSAFAFCDDYKSFLDSGKTEREAVAEIVRLADSAGFSHGGASDPKARVLWAYRKKNAAVAVRGSGDPADGIKVLVSHVDSPRLDLKQNPLYEDQALGLCKTHYYGGIKKYQWLARPIALHGTIVRADGEVVSVSIGEEAGDPVLTINDLLPHLSQKVQNPKKVSEAFPGEKLNLLVGSIPVGKDGDKDRVKLAVLDLLHRRYGIVEEDFVSAELEAVPAGPARDVGLDASFVGAYGHDDRVNVFTSLRAVLDAKRPKGTTVAIFLDKEEIGSEGNTGAQNRFLFDIVGDLLGGDVSERKIRDVLARSACLSCDVNAAIDPDWMQVYEARNAGRMGQGLSIAKFTGVRGKAGASDANAEFVGRVRNLFNTAGVAWHPAELGKIDEGGGGTIAKFFAVYGMDVLDVGPSVLAMHSPFEIASKADIYMAYKAYRAFAESF